MSEHKVTIQWRREGDFSSKTYNRSHQWDFGHGNTINASAASDFQGDKECVDPEQAFVAALASCHMLTFLAIAAKKQYVVDRYEDHGSREVQGRVPQDPRRGRTDQVGHCHHEARPPGENDRPGHFPHRSILRSSAKAAITRPDWRSSRPPRLRTGICIGGEVEEDLRSRRDHSGNYRPRRSEDSRRSRSDPQLSLHGAEGRHHPQHDPPCERPRMAGRVLAPEIAALVRPNRAGGT